MGSTGSIGTQALDVIRANKDHFTAEVLTAGSNSDLLIKQALEFQPNAVVIADEKEYQKVKEALLPHDIKVFAGEKSLVQIVEMESIDMVLASIVGYAGLSSTINAIKNKKPIALANKETLVVAGEIVTRTALENAVNLFPVDSEHSAIFQCLAGEFHNKIEKIYLTASGGPFRGKKKDFLQNVKKEQALKHPNWSMGEKITIDSATMMNKGLEIIEAKWLFSLKKEQIDVIIHPQSIIHSIVQFEDGSMKAQMGLPDMKLPIQYAFTYPDRIPSSFPRFDFLNYPQLTFEKPDHESFPAIQMALDCLQKGGNLACALNAANEIAVHAFLHDKISFLDIAATVEKVLGKINFVQSPSIETLMETDKTARTLAKEITG
ncbi:MAG: 1-deoxy-D-xylulose-5-phosphate reductoisomerase [Bacteroidia bacterium]|nr:1-deoxy-D-xylulose-5-phosphate reductoisomerase [Bacteroidia bacterium]